jgi:hypothetical protein
MVGFYGLIQSTRCDGMTTPSDGFPSGLTMGSLRSILWTPKYDDSAVGFGGEHGIESIYETRDNRHESSSAAGVVA